MIPVVMPVYPLFLFLGLVYVLSGKYQQEFSIIILRICDYLLGRIIKKTESNLL
jgi:hypothetical protein